VRYICTTCGTQFSDSSEPPGQCAICEDERQFVNWSGQEWTTLADVQQGHRNIFRPQGPRIVGVGTDPKFGIGQRALLVQTSEGNLLWDCVSLIDAATIQEITTLGGISALAVSHPHYYSSMIEWSHAFGGAPIYLHADDRQWIMRPSPEVRLWQGEQKTLFGGLTLIRCGGHFEGGAVVHWAEGEDGEGSLLVGDVIQVVQDRRYVSFMRSYPNYIPLPSSDVNHIVGSVEPYAFKRVYGAWWDAIVADDGKAAVRRSADRYLRALDGRTSIGDRGSA
jgi:hypothetical protein